MSCPLTSNVARRDVSPSALLAVAAERMALAVSGTLFVAGAAALMALLALQCAVASHASAQPGRRRTMRRPRGGGTAPRRLPESPALPGDLTCDPEDRYPYAPAWVTVANRDIHAETLL
jgi:hypothetical protein